MHPQTTEAAAAQIAAAVFHALVTGSTGVALPIHAAAAASLAAYTATLAHAATFATFDPEQAHEQTEEQARGVRHHSIAGGIRNPPPRPNAWEVEQAKADRTKAQWTGPIGAAL